jgi:hypothetical protein
VSLNGRPSAKRRRRAFATGGRPSERLAEALLAPGGIKPRSVNMVQVFHDDGCPCLDGQGMGACTCEVVEITSRELHPGNGSK